jgi:hypothetical protein
MNLPETISAMREMASSPVYAFRQPALTSAAFYLNAQRIENDALRRKVEVLSAIVSRRRPAPLDITPEEFEALLEIGVIQRSNT